jgi:hypothetical protein
MFWYMLEEYLGDFGHIIWGTFWIYCHNIYVVIGIEIFLMMMMYQYQRQ